MKLSKLLELEYDKRTTYIRALETNLIETQIDFLSYGHKNPDLGNHCDIKEIFGRGYEVNITNAKGYMVDLIELLIDKVGDIEFRSIFKKDDMGLEINTYKEDALRMHKLINKDRYTFSKLLENDKDLNEILKVISKMISKDCNIIFSIENNKIYIDFGSEIGLQIFNEWKEKLKADF